MERIYAAIDLKSFYASVECVERKLDPLKVNLVVADLSRTEKTICLAVSPSLKAHGIGGRARLFEVVQRVKEINDRRFRAADEKGLLPKDEQGNSRFASSSFFAPALEEDPALELSYLVAPPRMRLYETYSTKIFSIYLKYVAPEDIHVYSIDEVFIDLTRYLHTYSMTPYELTMAMIREVLYTTGITATAGIGTNLYLAKVAMDIVAKHIPPDQDGVRIAELDESSYRELLWCHRPLTDFWRVGRGYARRLESLGLYTMGDVARASLQPVQKALLYHTFGVNAELLIDHAWGWEPVTIEQIKAYRPRSNSLSSGQVLKEPYPFEKGGLIIKEMTELLAQDLVRKGLVTRQLVMTVGYDRASLKTEEGEYLVASTGRPYTGRVAADYYGRPAPRYAHGTQGLERYTNSARKLTAAASALYERITDPELVIRRVSIAVCGLIAEEEIPPDKPEQLSFFEDYTEQENRRREEERQDDKERRLLRAMLRLQDRYGKNAVLKGMNLLEGGTTRERNGQVGGHKA